MKAIYLFLSLCLTSMVLFAQSKSKSRSGALTQSKVITIPMQADRWEFAPQKAEFMTYKNVQGMKLLPKSGPVVLKDFIFSDGTIEFDVEQTESTFVGVYFRWQNAMESEFVYLRAQRVNNPKAIDAIQYAPIIGGVNMWDMLPLFQAPALIKDKEWNHIKLVVSELQMRVYVNNNAHSTLEIPRLEGNTKQGAIAFEGPAVYANLVVKPGQIEGLSTTEGIDLTNHDSRYIRSWAVTKPDSLPMGRELLNVKAFPTKETSWESIQSERQGLVNLTRMYGKSDSRRYVWLKTTIKAKSDLIRQVRMGFSDEVWVMLNGNPVYVDKNLYGAILMKPPFGRCSIENTSFTLPLKAGDNELLIGVANSFYGWGVIARFDNLDDIELAEK
ncbi:hypothetical protein QNI16_16015 [Cytophagaceae bacterium YF14B1]|uniref:3-keto-disaccharide hydrolase domain-containing protein n=1 Tax=Xanthocytophaga flava TaxID=3048013 RepID=A0AAE3QRB8_9BACT|nr:hypothetical protein [Xanthocytophaga flavus]MDJ1482008.1 hypothetical protein [Xanthocytophaga flavus]